MNRSVHYKRQLFYKEKAKEMNYSEKSATASLDKKQNGEVGV